MMAGNRRDRSRSPTRADITGRRRENKTQDGNKQSGDSNNMGNANVMNPMMMQNMYQQGNMMMGGMYPNMMMGNMMGGGMMPTTGMEMMTNTTMSTGMGTGMATSMGSGMEMMQQTPMDMSSMTTPIPAPPLPPGPASMDMSMMGGMMMDPSMMSMYPNMGSDLTPVQEKKEIILKHCKLTPPSAGSTAPPRRARPPGCRTIFVGGLPEKIRESTVRDIFEPYGRIHTLRLSKKDFCHIRFDRESSVDAAMQLAGYRIKLTSKDDKDDEDDSKATTGWLHVDYALSRDDQNEYERKQRQVMRQQQVQMQQLAQQELASRSLGGLGGGYRRSPSPVRIQPFSNAAIVQLNEKIKSEEHFAGTIPVSDRIVQVQIQQLAQQELASRSLGGLGGGYRRSPSPVRIQPFSNAAIVQLNEKIKSEEHFAGTIPVSDRIVQVQIQQLAQQELASRSLGGLGGGYRRSPSPVRIQPFSNAAIVQLNEKIKSEEHFAGTIPVSDRIVQVQIQQLAQQELASRSLGGLGGGYRRSPSPVRIQPFSNAAIVQLNEKIKSEEHFAGTIPVSDRIVQVQIQQLAQQELASRSLGGLGGGYRRSPSPVRIQPFSNAAIVQLNEKIKSEEHFAGTIPVSDRIVQVQIQQLAQQELASRSLGGLGGGYRRSPSPVRIQPFSNAAIVQLNEKIKSEEHFAGTIPVSDRIVQVQIQQLAQQELASRSLGGLGGGYRRSPSPVRIQPFSNAAIVQLNEKIKSEEHFAGTIPVSDRIVQVQIQQLAQQELASRSLGGLGGGYRRSPSPVRIQPFSNAAIVQLNEKIKSEEHFAGTIPVSDRIVQVQIQQLAQQELASRSLGGLGGGYRRSPSPVRIQPFSNAAIVQLNEKIKSEEHFAGTIPVSDRIVQVQIQQLAQQELASRSLGGLGGGYRRSPSPVRIQPFSNAAIVQLNEKIKSEEHFAGTIPVSDRIVQVQIQQLAQQELASRSLGGLGGGYRRSPSPVRIQPFSNAAIVQLNEKIKSEEHFAGTIPTLIAWLERGECSKKNSNQFYSMIQATNSHIRRLFNEKMQAEEELQECKERVKNHIERVIEQLEQVAKVFSAAGHQRVWDHFTKPQRKNIETWQKMTQEFNSLKEEFMEKFFNEDNEYNNGYNNRSIMDMGGSDEVQKLKLEKDSLQFQLEAYKNEVEVIKADAQKEMEKFKAQFIARQALQGVVDKNPPLPQPVAKPPPPPPLPDDMDAKVQLKEAVEAGCGEAKLIGVMAAFLQVHPHGASLDYVVSYVRALFPHVTQATVHHVLQKHPDVFERSTSGVGANIESRWLFCAFRKDEKP